MLGYLIGAFIIDQVFNNGEISKAIDEVIFGGFFTKLLTRDLLRSGLKNDGYIGGVVKSMIHKNGIPRISLDVLDEDEDLYRVEYEARGGISDEIYSGQKINC